MKRACRSLTLAVIAAILTSSLLAPAAAGAQEAAPGSTPDFATARSMFDIGTAFAFTAVTMERLEKQPARFENPSQEKLYRSLRAEVVDELAWLARRTGKPEFKAVGDAVKQSAPLAPCRARFSRAWKDYESGSVRGGAVGRWYLDLGAKLLELRFRTWAGQVPQAQVALKAVQEHAKKKPQGLPPRVSTSLDRLNRLTTIVTDDPAVLDNVFLIQQTMWD